VKNCYEHYKKLLAAEESFQNLQLDSKTSILKFEEQGKNRSLNNPEKQKNRQNLAFAFPVLFTINRFLFDFLVCFVSSFFTPKKQKLDFFSFCFFICYLSFELKNQILKDTSKLCIFFFFRPKSLHKTSHSKNN